MRRTNTAENSVPRRDGQILSFATEQLACAGAQRLFCEQEHLPLRHNCIVVHYTKQVARHWLARAPAGDSAKRRRARPPREGRALLPPLSREAVLRRRTEHRPELIRLG